MEKTSPKVWRLISVLLLVLSFVSLSAQAGTYGGGDGTAANPYQIWTAQQMNTIGLSANSGDLNKHFKLMADIDLSAYTGTQFNMIGIRWTGPTPQINFTGVFDGNGKTISNFTYSFSGTSNFGLFVFIGDEAVIKNLRLKSANIVAVPGQTSGLRVGALVGRMYGGIIEDCCAEDVNISAGYYSIGGLVGEVEGGSIIGCYSTGTVSGSKYQVGGLVGSFYGSMISESYSKCDVYGEMFVGGLVSGTGSDSIVFNCYSTGTVQGSDSAGGLVGLHYGTISDCYSTGKVTGSIRIGGFAGRNEGTITNCFWDIETSGKSYGVGYGSSSGVTRLTTEEMMSQNNFVSTGWDFLGESANGTEDIWTMCRWVTYPLFSREVSPPGSVYYVDVINGSDSDPNHDGLSQGSAFATIQKGIDTAWHDNTIIVLPGRYHENINFGAKRLTLRSFDPNHPDETIIDGNDLDSVVTFAGSENANCRLTGFTVTGGNAAGNGGGIQGNFTGAAISNCIIKNNISQNRGGGVSRCDGVLEGCIISDNAAKNRGGGLLGCNGTMSNCLINDNSVGYLQGSTEGYGGGLYSCSADIINCTIAFNAAKGRAGGLDGCNGTIANCIVWANELEQMLNCSVPTYSCIQNWTGIGTGNISTDPEFVDPNNGDYHLLTGSPCIDAADPNYVAAPNATDIGGKPRIINGVVDIGAYEAVVLPMLEVEMKFTPQTLNPGSQGNWVKAHFVLPEGFGVEDVDANTPAVIAPFGIESDHINVFINEDGLVEIEAAFSRSDFCSSATSDDVTEVIVIGLLNDGRNFYGTDTTRIINNKLGYVGSLASYWLVADCGPPDWCGRLDVDHDSVVDWLDFAMSDGCCIEVIGE